MALMLFIVFFVLILLNAPIFVALLASSLVYVMLLDIPPTMVIQRMFSVAQSFPLLAIPFFMLTGELMSKGGLSSRLINLAKVLVGHIKGGLAQVVVVFSMFMAAVSGSAVANASAVSSIIVPEMEKRGYDKGFIAALIATSSTIGILIPPSIPMVVYGWITNQSVAKLLLSGAVPGVFLGVMFMILSAYMAYRRNYPREERASLRRFLHEFRTSFFALLTPVIIIGGIFSGIMTPTEAGAIASVWAFIIGLFVYKDLKWSMLLNIIVDTAIMTAGVMIIIASANIFTWLLAYNQIPDRIAELILSITTNKFLILMIINIILLFTGMVIDLTPALMIMTPILLPIATSIGVDPIHFGAIMVLNLGIGLYTPPVGTTIFVASSVAKVKMESMIKPLLPFFAVAFLVLMAVTYIPIISMWLPSLMK
ncbi:MAG: C4-dicarboxylate transporter, DctM subunit [Clostridiales bacterium]|nr:C4-dicarboxylate transporter, DctM subunit [Clostridiales bacterium]